MMHCCSAFTIVALLPLVMALFGEDVGVPGNCSVYDKGAYSQCSQNCGKCFNPGGRAGTICDQGSTAGYLCQGAAYACMDWTFGSLTMKKAEAAFAANTSDPVYFGVGSFGSSDQMKGLGACYRIKVQGVDRDLIVQAINTGGDVQGNQFDLQVGDGGFGANNKCAGSSGSMYPGGTAAWGDMYGGVKTKAECSGLPLYPTDPAPMKAAGDDLVSLCEYSFDKGVRKETDPSNPTMMDLARVKCPPALIELTQLERKDDPDKYTGPSMPGFPNNGTMCQSQPWDLSYCLTRMMDCCKPSAGWINNVVEDLVVATKKVVQFCTQDGYTRIDVQCGCFDCDC